MSRGQFSQVHKMRTVASIFRSTCLEILRSLSIGANSGGTHFIRCVRADLDYEPRGFYDELVCYFFLKESFFGFHKTKNFGSFRIQEKSNIFVSLRFDNNYELWLS